MNRTLIDRHGRAIEYLRVSITDLCNLRCIYCRPPEGVKLVDHKDILRYEEILEIVRVAQGMGVRKIRVTGGEPLVRRGVLGFIGELGRLSGLEDIGLTTNGALLTKMATDLKVAGLTRINISLDSLRRNTFKRITGADKLPDVLAGIHKALEVGLNPVKINVVLLEGINEPDLPKFARMTLELPVDVRFIERMPFGGDAPPESPGSFGAHKLKQIITSQVGELMPLERGPLDGPAAMFRLEGAEGRIGIIDPVTGHFCNTCNRLRLTARGTLRPCLMANSEIDIKTPLRNGADSQELERVIQSAVNAKPAGNCSSKRAVNDSMNFIGG
ncbi:GTP 3',8-cyclase MoaA [Thermodesulfobacteriota bacterium]